MTARRMATAAAVVAAPLVLSVAIAPRAVAHGSMQNPVSRVLACYAENPESPRSAACRAAVAVSGTQAFYDWNAVRLADAGGRSRQIIPDGKLCSAGTEEFKGLDLARADWPATRMTSGPFTFTYRATAPHRGTFALYITKDGYDPSKPLAWSDLEPEPFATATNPPLQNGSYVIQGNVPKKSGRHLIYSVWQRSDSPEAFYTCSDVVFGQKGGGSAGSAAPSASAPSDTQIAAGASRSSMRDMAGMAGMAHPSATPTSAPAANRPVADGSAAPVAPISTRRLAETGGSGATSALALAGVTIVAVGVCLWLTALRRRLATGGRRRG